METEQMLLYFIAGIYLGLVLFSIRRGNKRLATAFVLAAILGAAIAFLAGFSTILPGPRLMNGANILLFAVCGAATALSFWLVAFGREPRKSGCAFDTLTNASRRRAGPRGRSRIAADRERTTLLENEIGTRYAANARMYNSRLSVQPSLT